MYLGRVLLSVIMWFSALAYEYYIKKLSLVWKFSLKSIAFKTFFQNVEFGLYTF